MIALWLVVGVLACIAAVTYAIERITKTLGATMERLLQTASMGQSPAEISVVARPPLGSSTEVPSLGTSVTEEPALPPLEMTVRRLATDLQRQYREMGTPVSADEAELQARMMVAESGLLT